MNFVNPISRGQLPTFQEGSPYAVLRDGRATGKQWSKNATTTAKSANNSNAISVLQRHVARLGRRVLGGSSTDGLKLQLPNLELDGTVAVSKNTVVYISPANLLVTSGATDLGSGVNTKSQPGLWIAVQDVPADTGSGYNVPQWPLPGAGATPSGNPLAGDADSDNVFWVPMSGDAAPCSNLV